MCSLTISPVLIKLCPQSCWTNTRLWLTCAGYNMPQFKHNLHVLQPVNPFCFSSTFGWWMGGGPGIISNCKRVIFAINIPPYSLFQRIFPYFLHLPGCLIKAYQSFKESCVVYDDCSTLSVIIRAWDHISAQRWSHSRLLISWQTRCFTNCFLIWLERSVHKHENEHHVDACTKNNKEDGGGGYQSLVSQHSGKQADSNQLRTSGGWGDP